MRSATLLLALLLVGAVHTSPRALGRTAAASDPWAITIVSAHVSLDGTSNVHAFTAATTDVRATAIDVSGPVAGDRLDHVLEPGALKAFDITIPAASLTSPREGIDRDMHKALRVRQHPEIRFRLHALEPDAGMYRATGLLTIAGVEKEIALDLEVQRNRSTLAVTGATDLVMTDFGIVPPKALMGMVRANPEIRVRLDLVLAVSAGSL